jgi:hypothetical protein
MRPPLGPSRPGLLVATVLVALVGAAAALAAQDASPYVPLEHWTMPYVEHLIARGLVRDPTPLTRPFRRHDLVAALQAVDTLTASASELHTLHRLLAALDVAHPAPRYRIVADVGLAAATYARRDPLAAITDTGPRQAGVGHGTVNGGLDIEFAFGPVVAVTHPYLDTRLKYDPDWYGQKTRVVAGRAAESYVTAQWRFGEVFFGRLDRNWGPSGIQGLYLSDNPYGLDHLGIALGTANFQLQAIATQLEDRVDSTGALVHRYMRQHRLWVRPNNRLALALWEGTIPAGPGRQFEPWYLNIMNLGLLEQQNAGGKIESALGLDIERHGTVTLFAQYMQGDIQVDRKGPADLKPTSYGLTVGATGSLGVAAAAWTAFYTRVANLAYRDETNYDTPQYHGLGTGRNFADYDQATVQLGLLPRPGLLLHPELTLLRQGEGDPRHPFPPVAAYPTTPTIFQGTVERTLRAALSGTYAPTERLGVTFDVGVHHITNFQHVTGDTRTKFIGSVGVNYRFAWMGALP